MKVLFLSRWYPYPADNGSKLRVSALLRGLCERHEVTLISFCNPDEPREDGPAEGPRPVRVEACPFREFERGSRRALLGYLSGTPRFLVDTHSTEMEARIRQAVATTRFDLVIASQLSMAAYHDAFPDIPAVFDEVELGVYWPEAAGTSWARARHRLTWAKHSRFMARLLQRFAFATVASEAERTLVARAAPGYGAVHVVPNTVDTSPDGPEVGRRPESLIFTGSMRFAPNRDAMHWFVREIFPRVRARVPGATLTITGDPGPEPPPETEGVALAGRVPDVRPLLASSAVSLAPIRTGGGTRLKILEAMALGTPVVSTTKAAEGLDVRNGEHLLLADTPEDFAAAVERLLRDQGEARAMAARARELFKAKYGADVVVGNFLRLVEHAVAA